MILLDLSNPFTFQLRDQHGNETILSGTFREFTKAEKQDAKNKHEKAIKRGLEAEKIGRKITINERQMSIKEKLEDYEAVDKLFTETISLSNKLEKLNDTVDMETLDDGLVSRFDLCLGGEQKEEIIELAKAVGYQTVYGKIVEGIQEGKPNA